MRIAGKGQVIMWAVASLWLAGCDTSAQLTDQVAVWLGRDPAEEPVDGVASLAASADVSTTGSIPVVRTDPSGLTAAAIPGSDEDLNRGKKFYRTGNFRLAERSFRRAVESHPQDAEAWIGLAASYDGLKRFDMADRAYEQAAAIIGTTPELLNNRGYSYLLRGDYVRARTTLLQAKSMDPANPYVQNNLALLAKSARKGKSVE